MEDVNVMNANAWVQTAINIGNQKQVNVFNKKLLIEYLPEIRKMTLQNPEIFYPRLEQLLAECGVALVLLPNLRNCGINGAVKWVNKEKVILAINNRRKYADTFWFSLFHELGHVLQQRIKVLLVSGDEVLNNSDELLQRLEKEADIFSQNVLIPEQAYQEFLQNTWTIYESDIVNFAREIGVHPGIVLGRLQMEKRVPYNTKMNSLKIKYEVA